MCQVHTTVRPAHKSAFEICAHSLLYGLSCTVQQQQEKPSKQPQKMCPACLDFRALFPLLYGPVQYCLQQ